MWPDNSLEFEESLVLEDFSEWGSDASYVVGDMSFGPV